MPRLISNISSATPRRKRSPNSAIGRFNPKIAGETCEPGSARLELFPDHRDREGLGRCTREILRDNGVLDTIAPAKTIEAIELCSPLRLEGTALSASL